MGSNTNRYQISPAFHAGAIAAALVAVAALWAVTQLVGLGLTPFHTRGEPREAVVVQDLIARGEWILPRRGGVMLPRKPPLYYWLAGLAARARGAVDEAGVRLPSAVQSGAAALLLAGVAGSLAGAPAALLSGLVLLTSFEWLRAATAARVDMTLAFGLTLVFVGLSMLAQRERGLWRALVYAGAAWATLAKGIPGLAIPVLQIALMCAAERSLAPLRRVRPLTGLAVVVVIAGAWYAAAAWRGGRAFVDIVVNENLVRIVGGERFAPGHEHSVPYLIAVLAAGLLPWTFFLPAVAAWLWRARASLHRADPRLIALLWIAAVFAPYAVASSKRGVYLLPLYPAVALLVGWWGAAVLRGEGASRQARVLVWGAWLIAAVAAVLALAGAADWIGIPVLHGFTTLLDPRAAADLRAVAAHVAGAREPILAGLLAAAAAAAVIAALSGARQRWIPTWVALTLCIVALVGAVRWVILPGIATSQSRAPVVAALRGLGGGGDVGRGATVDYGVLYYWGEPLQVYRGGRDAEPPRYLVLPVTEWLRMTPAERRRWRRVPGLGGQSNRDALAVLERAE
jgi:4-amino-4-deoxy-L-arabinose transferase-like glycosyltransferase